MKIYGTLMLWWGCPWDVDHWMLRFHLQAFCFEAFWEDRYWITPPKKKKGMKLWLANAPLEIVLLLRNLKSLDSGTRIAYIEISKCHYETDPKVGTCIPYQIHGSFGKWQCNSNKSENHFGVSYLLLSFLLICFLRRLWGGIKLRSPGSLGQRFRPGFVEVTVPGLERGDVGQLPTSHKLN